MAFSKKMYFLFILFFLVRDGITKVFERHIADIANNGLGWLFALRLWVKGVKLVIFNLFKLI